MFGSLGLPELMIVFVIALSWLLPVAAGIWAIVTLNRIAIAQHALGAQLETIEQLLRARRDGD
jgi:hypothetical protein